MADCPVGQPQKLELLLALTRYPNVFVKISHMWSLSRQPYPYLDAQAQAQRLHKAFGADRLMAGTDWPISLRQLPYAQSVSLYRDYLNFLTPMDKARVLSENVQKIWPFPGFST
jgi:predicted TIM-barrel fold metal-dependent hydrolase